MSRLLWLPQKLRDAGLTVIEEPNWMNRGDDWQPGKPIGTMTHHTACCMPYPIGRLYNGKIKCNLSVQPGPDFLGQIHMVAAGRCNWSSGPGSKVVRSEVMRDIAPSGSAYRRGLTDDGSGNPWYINDEVAHPGDGSPLPPGMYLHLIVSWAVICTHFGWTANRNIAHGEHTRRKIDPKWNGMLLHANQEAIRADVFSYMSSGALPLGSPPTLGREDMYQEIDYRQGYGAADGDPAVKRWQEIFDDLGYDLGSWGIDGEAGPTFFGIVDTITGQTDSRHLGAIEGGMILALYQKAPVIVPPPTPPDLSNYLQDGDTLVVRRST